MTQAETLDQLIDSAEAAVRRTLEYLEGPGATSTARIDRWGVWEISAHLLHWHRVTAEAAQAAARGEAPVRITSPVDDINAEVVAKAAGMSLQQIATELSQVHQTMIRAIRDLPDADVVLMHRPDGSSPSAKDRLRTIAHHWTEHLEELLAAAGA
ncbi:MAG: DinB family protein [Chloroflexi bacterium]|nr:DinB family protein [Chloroflexota bacterium]